MRHPSSLTRLRLLASCVVLQTLAATIDVPRASSQTVAAHAQLVMLGTGTPAADPERFGPATAVVVNDTAYSSMPVPASFVAPPLPRGIARSELSRRRTFGCCS